MGINLGGSIGSLYLRSTQIKEAYLGSIKVYSSGPTPIVLPDKTLRFQFANTSYTPSAGSTSSHGTWTAVNAAQGIWDWNYNNTNWFEEFKNKLTSSIIGGNVNLIAANINGVNDFESLFAACTSLRDITCDIDLSNVTGTVAHMFNGCSTLLHSPIIAFGNVSNITNMYRNCYEMENTMQAWSTIARGPAGLIFNTIPYLLQNCGRDSSHNVLSQIPNSVGGTLAGTTTTAYRSASSKKSVSATMNGPFRPGDTFSFTHSSSSSNPYKSGSLSLTIDATNTCQQIGNTISYGDVYNADVTGKATATATFSYALGTVSVTVRRTSYNAVY